MDRHKTIIRILEVNQGDTPGRQLQDSSYETPSSQTRIHVRSDDKLTPSAPFGITPLQERCLGELGPSPSSKKPKARSPFSNSGRRALWTLTEVRRPSEEEL